MDDILEIVKQDVVNTLTQHLNIIDKSESIKYMHGSGKDGSIQFLVTLIVRKPDKSVKLLVFHKATYTDQYLAFDSHQPLQHKLVVVRTLVDRCQAIVSEPEDREKEMTHIKKALKTCGYPAWTFHRLEQQRKQKQQKQDIKQKDKEVKKDVW